MLRLDVKSVLKRGSKVGFWALMRTVWLLKKIFPPNY